MLVVRSKFAVTFAAGWPQRHIQVILRRYACVADVILQFDIDCCQFAYDGARVWATPAAQRALRSGVLIADPEWRSATYESRLYKYCKRGFALAVPGLDEQRISCDLCYGAFTYQQGALRKVSAVLPEDRSEAPIYTLGPELRGLAKLIAQDALASSNSKTVGAQTVELNERSLSEEASRRERRRRQAARRAADEVAVFALAEISDDDDGGGDDEGGGAGAGARRVHRRRRGRGGFPEPLIRLGYSTSLGFSGASQPLRAEEVNMSHVEPQRRAYLVDVLELRERRPAEQRAVLDSLERGLLYSWPPRKRRDADAGEARAGDVAAADDYDGVLLPYTPDPHLRSARQMAQRLLERLGDRDNPLPPIVWDLIVNLDDEAPGEGEESVWSELWHVLDATKGRTNAWYETHLEPVGFPRRLAFLSSQDAATFERMKWLGWFDDVYEEHEVGHPSGSGGSGVR